MKHINGIISLDTFPLRQETIVQHIKPKDLAHTTILGIRENDDPTGYIHRNTALLDSHKEILESFLDAYPQTAIITNYYFAILPETWEFIKKHQEKIADILLITCQDDFCTQYAQPNNYPITAKDIISYHDDHGRWKDDLKDALQR